VSFVCDDDTVLCRSRKACTPELCALHQRCNDTDPLIDGICLPECDPGYEWQSATETCAGTPADCQPGSPQSILQDCADLHRTCVENGDTAACGACDASSHYLEVNGACVRENSCPTLTCADDFKTCSEDADGIGRCGDCIDGYVSQQGTGACRALVTCDALGCPTNQMCIPPTSTHDAQCYNASGDACVNPPNCGEGFAWNAVAKKCTACTGTCVATESSTGVWYPVTTNDDRCICTTRDGYFFTTANDISIKPCDADHDGFVRRSAYAELSSPNDCALRLNARCTVRRVDRFVFRPDDRPEFTKILSQDAAVSGELGPDGTLALYEVDANDSFDVRVAGNTQVPILMPYLQGAALSSHTLRAVEPREINSFTKACVADPNGREPSADYNANGVADVVEWQEMPLPVGTPDWQRPFARFSYFFELFNGWYEPSAADATLGSYVLAERNRSSEYGAHLDPDDMSLDTSPWMTGCVRRTDGAYSAGASVSTPNIGMDFGRWSTDVTHPEAGYLGHPSMFKCLVNKTSLSGANQRAVPHEWLYQTDHTYDGQQCGLYTVDAAGASENTNPVAPVFRCSTADLTEPGQLMWGVSNYVDYDGVQTHYVRGCINECVDAILLPEGRRCPGFGQPNSGCHTWPGAGERKECTYDAGCSTCVQIPDGWYCTEKPFACGTCGRCLSVENTALPSSSCRENTLNGCIGNCLTCGYVSATGTFDCYADQSRCTGTCDRCNADGSGGTFRCGAIPVDDPAYPCSGNCAVCAQTGSTFNCAGDDSKCGTATDCNKCLIGTPAPYNFACGPSDSGCNPGYSCNPSDYACVDCLNDAGCPLTGLRKCKVSNHTCVQCLADADCSGATPRCDTSTNTCVRCVTSAHCSDGLFCNGAEVCTGSHTCQAGTPPVCTYPSTCDETRDACVECTSASQCNDGVGCTNDLCVNYRCQHNDNCSAGCCTAGGCRNPCP